MSFTTYYVKMRKINKKINDRFIQGCGAGFLLSTSYFFLPYGWAVGSKAADASAHQPAEHLYKSPPN